MPYAFSTKANGVGNVIDAADINNLQDAIIRTAGRIIVPPVDAGFSWLNQGTSTVTTDANGNVVMTTPTGATTLRGRTRPVPAVPYTITARIIPQAIASGSSFMGLFWADATPKIVLAGLRSSQAVLAVEKWNTATSFNAAYTSPTASVIYTLEPRWMRLVDDNTNRIVQVSSDGDYWVTVHTVTRLDFLTPTLVGYFFRNESGVNGDVVVASWEGA